MPDLNDEMTNRPLKQPLQRLRSSMLVYVRSAVLQMIRSMLFEIGGDDAVQIFRFGYFGYFLDFRGGDVQKKTIQALMAQEVRVPDAALEGRKCRFHIGRSELRFSPSEFCIVSGLRFSTSKFNPNAAHTISD